MQYTEPHGARLDARWFAAMFLSVKAKKIWDVHTGRVFNTRVEAWIKQWCHWVRRCVTGSLCNFRKTDSPFVRRFEKSVYKGPIGDILSNLQASPFPKWPCHWLI